jgi:hypothetical protein
MLFSNVDFCIVDMQLLKICCLYWRRKERCRCGSWPFHVRCCAFWIPIAALTLDAIRCGNIYKVFLCLNTMLAKEFESRNTFQTPVTFMQTA